jgi:hypothetical protein
MRKVVFRIIITITAFALVGCGTSGGSSVMYPEPVQSGSAIKSDTAIVLVGNGGSDVINYLQFEHSGLPAINARGITLAPGGIVAIPVPVGTSRLSLSNYTASRRPGGYLPNGMAMGYVPVRTPPIEINSPGLYYVATILPDQQPNFESRPNGAQLAKWRKERPELSSLKPVNFSWSN